MKIGCIGEAMLELVLQDGDPMLGVAGDTLNTAVYLARAAQACDVSYITALGTDPLSDRIAAFIAENGVGTARVTRIEGKAPGLYAISTDAQGERSFTYWRSASAARDLFQSGFAQLDGLDAVYLSGISLAILPDAIRWALLSELRARRLPVAFDSNYRPSLWEDDRAARAVTAAYWEIAEICLPSLDDEMALFGESAEDVIARFGRLGTRGALKRGASGPLSLSEAVHQQYLPAARVVDTTSAGDSFNGGYLGAIWTGKSQAEALMSGHNLAAQVVGHRGAIIPQSLLNSAS